MSLRKLLEISEAETLHDICSGEKHLCWKVYDVLVSKPCSPIPPRLSSFRYCWEVKVVSTVKVTRSFRDTSSVS